MGVDIRGLKTIPLRNVENISRCDRWLTASWVQVVVWQASIPMGSARSRGEVLTDEPMFQVFKVSLCIEGPCAVLLVKKFERVIALPRRTVRICGRGLNKFNQNGHQR